MNLVNRYKNGECEQVVDEVLLMGKEAFHPKYSFEIDALFTEIFGRVAYNLDAIYEELKQIDYKFFNNKKYNSFTPRHKPLSNTEELLKRLSETVSIYGYVPLSLVYFYRIVGGVNFAWNYDEYPSILWEMADPIQVSSLDDLVSYVSDEYWKEDMKEYLDDPTYGNAFLEISADDLHKDNISGGPPYSIQITKEKSIDSKVLNEANNTTFINYLRICFKYGGFPGMEFQESSKSYDEFLINIQKILKPI